MSTSATLAVGAAIGMAVFLLWSLALTIKYNRIKHRRNSQQRRLRR